ncbi:uncharacterized protein PHACADRAFT_109021 [Phanerochaete carnosa HHB-10118-sp]|uniref:Uncharacterized protein n=2 Tax=Phanerochaete carnosa (strain HHB-10118-sp) TaxID=650164 RepID=K5WE15_PHACS|nr:uncharacterized protein PHACADRAFT_109021 [Phanerochaete carnosa HHB-10118-sp]EKM48392.1 hypothetical protein PHACADRAFT_109021 [Phanerochaete carnosa HHB-10118-sp]
MRRERIRCVRQWRNEGPRRDCAFVVKDSSLPGFRGLDVVRVMLLFSFTYQEVEYPCALVHWFVPADDKPDENTGMWVVEPDMDPRGKPVLQVIHLDTMLRAAHLVGAAGHDSIPRTLQHYRALDMFRAFYVNKYADHHAHTIAF